MRNYCILGLVLLLLAGCGEQAKLEKLVKSRLRDPESAKFKDFIVSDKKTRACLIFNAKNGFGGYGSWSVAEFQKTADVWEVKSLDGHESNCSDLGFKALDTGEQVLLDSRVEFIRLVAKLNEISEHDAKKVAKWGRCPDLALSYELHASGLAEERVRGNEAAIKYHETKLQDTLKSLNKTSRCN